MVFTAVDERYEVACGGTYPGLRMMLAGGGNAGFTVRGEYVSDVIYRIEEARGYEYKGALYAPGQFRLDLEPGQEATLFSGSSGRSVLRVLKTRTCWPLLWLRNRPQEETQHVHEPTVSRLRTSRLPSCELLF
jgi:hypothetical protein